MKRNILIIHDANEIQVAIVENGRLEEFYIERFDAHRQFGNIYKGKVKTVIRGIGAAFINLGTPKDGFLYVADALKSPIELDADFEDSASTGQNGSGESQPKSSSKNHHRRHDRHKRIDEVLKVGQEVIVQVVKEPIGNKGPRLTTHFSIPARYLVMMPGDQKVGLSRRIEDRKERDRIRSIFKKLDIPKEVGFIVRTAADGKSEKEFTRDIKYLLRMWKEVHKQINSKKAPALIHQELDLVERVIRDHLVEETDTIIVNTKELQHRIKKFLNLYLPKSAVQVQLHKGNSLFEEYNVAKDINRTFNKNVYLKSGGHLVIEQTEALVVIDVNTGKFTGSKDLEETVFKTNLEAAEEVARQMRLRDMGGIIIIDFIDMERHEHRREVLRKFREAVRRDRAKTNILPISELGLVEMTRQRIRPSHESHIFDNCNYCDGNGVVKSATTMAIETVRELRRSIGTSKGRILNAYVHPEVSKRMMDHEKKALQYLERTTQSKIYLFAEPSLHIEDVNITFVK